MTVFNALRMQRTNRTGRPQRLLMAGGFTLTCLLSNPARAVDQYCARANPGLCTLNTTVGFSGNSNTYFWSPVTAPVTGSNTFDLNAAAFVNKVRKITLRGSSTVTLNANGSATQAEVLIGSLGSNLLQGKGAPTNAFDTYVVGNPPANVNCQASGVTCQVSGMKGTENDNVVLTGSGTNVIYIDRCLQMTAPNTSGQPGSGGAKIATATKASGADANYGPITDAAGTCPVASLGIQALQTAVLREREALRTPWERWWSATARWSQELQWLRQAMVALIEGPHARAATVSATPGKLNAATSVRIARYEGVTRVILNQPKGNFFRAGAERGNTLVVNSGNHPFNQQSLQPSRSNGTVYKQVGVEPIPLNRGIVFVYHEPIGILAAYPNDRYPYGSKRNRGSVIAQLVLGDGTALPAGSIDSVLLKNLNLSECGTPRPTTDPGRPLRIKP
jgi:hypothetical protein